MAVKHLLTRGYGNGTFAGTIPLVVLRGYSIGAVPVQSGGTLKYDANLNQRVQTCTQLEQRVAVKTNLGQRIDVEFDIENC